MADDFLDKLRADWRRDGPDSAQASQGRPDLAAIGRRGARRRRLARLSMLASLATAFVAILLAGWFGYRAAATGDAVIMLGAAGLLFAVPLLIVEAIDKSRSLSLRYDSTPRGVLLEARHRAATARRFLVGFRLSAAILLACAAASWVLAAAGYADRGEALFLTGVWAGTALGVWLWQMWRDRRLAAEIACGDRLLAELAGAEGDDPPPAP